MNSIKFPNMFGQRSTNIVEDLEATKQNLKLVLHTKRGELFGDPYFGSTLIKYMFEQNSQILADIVVDEIYSIILTFMPQILVQRKDINVYSDGAHIYANIRAKNMLDYTTNMYSINLTSTQIQA